MPDILLTDNFSVSHPRSYELYLSRSEKRLKNSGLNGDLNADLCNTSAVLCHLSFQANRALDIIWVYDKPLDG